MKDGELKADSLGELERTLMGLLWKNGASLCANEIRDDVNSANERQLALTTILTVLSRLEKKNLVERDRSQRPHRYRPAQSREDYTAQLMNHALGQAGDRELALGRFVGSVSKGDAELLHKLLEARIPHTRLKKFFTKTH